MNVKILKFFCVLIILFVSMAGLACASKRINLIKNGTRKLEIIPSRGIHISKVYVIQEGDRLLIKGTVKRRSSYNVGSGHIDISIISPEGEVLEKASTNFIPRIIPSRPGRRKSLGSRFEVRLPTIPPAGSKVHVAYHRVSKTDNWIFSCGENMAVSESGI